MIIHPKFWSNKVATPIANTVEELRNLLDELPSDLPLNGTVEVFVLDVETKEPLCVVAEIFDDQYEDDDRDEINISGLDFEV